MGAIEFIPLKKLREVTVQDNGESLVDLRDKCPGITFKIADYLNTGKAEYEDAYFVRESVAEMINGAQNQLPEGQSLLVRCGYRTPKVQRRQFKRDYHALKKEHPNWEKKQLDIEIENRTSSVDVAPHCTGAAIDLSIVDTNGKQLDMGTKMGTFGSKTHTSSKEISTTAQKNRRILLKIMEGVGFHNFPGEWWHFAYGDREWATQNNTNSFYGPIKNRPQKRSVFSFPIFQASSREETE